MSESSFDAAVGAERAEVRRRAEANPGVAYVGDATGQLALVLDPPVEGIRRATITATTAPPLPRETAPYYHATVHLRPEEAADGPAREVYRHPFPALDWIAEAVPDFDLIETTYVDPLAGSEPAGD